MARLNLLNLNFGPRTHEGAPARNLTPELQLRRSVLASLLWESQFYEDGVEIAGRIAELVPKVEAANVAALAVEAREQMKLRHAPLLLVREMARHATHRRLVAGTLERVIQRAAELAEFVAIYWKDVRVPGQTPEGI
jgi:60 kDa SS-A/Ro ribonucleoprotein